jgi:hypothetical protein
MLDSGPSPEERFLEKVDKNGAGGCWLWLRNKNNMGYGMAWNGKRILAHRMAYELLVGPIPEGLTLDHLCHPLCVWESRKGPSRV